MAKCIILTGGTWNLDGWSKFQRNVGGYRVATALNDAGYDTFVFDYIINFTTDEIIEVLSKHLTEETLWVGFSSTFYWFPEHGKSGGNGDILKLKELYWTFDEEVNRIKKYIRDNSNAKLVYGGTKSEFFLGKDPDIDYWVTGLADTSIVAMTDYISNKTSELKSEAIVNVDGRTVNVIDSRDYPEPAMHEVRTKWFNPGFNVMKNEGLPMEWARGCIFKCKFCTYPLLGKKKGTYLRDPEEIRDDMTRNYELYGTTDYFITDDTVNDDNDKLEALHRVMTSLPFKPRFAGFFRLDLINRWPHTADLLAEMGLVGTFFGLETLHPESAKSIGKGLHPNRVKDRLYWLQERWHNKVNMAGGMILGLPHDSYEYFDETIEWFMEKDNPMDHIQFYPLHLNDTSKKEKPGLYVSEFNLHPDIYGYEFPGENNYMMWENRHTGLSYTVVNQIAMQFNQRRDSKNKIAGFEVIRYLNLGIDMQDIYDLESPALREKYDIPALNDARVLEYKKLLGLG